MKKILCTLVAATLALQMHAQEGETADTLWKYSGITSLNMSQLALYNWSAGGENNLAGNALVKLAANYDNGNLAWNNNLTLGFGLIKQGDNPTKKSDDQINFSSVVGYKASEKWYYSGLLDFKTQFAHGYEDPDLQTNKISNFMAPAYMNFSLGMAYKANDKFSLFISPLSSKYTFVLDEDLSAAGSFGLDPGQQVRAEFGAYLAFRYKNEILKNVVLDTKLDLFSNYLENPQYVDVNWDVLITFKINEYLSASLMTQLIYDWDVKFTNEDTGEEEARIQFKELFGLGLTYSF